MSHQKPPKNSILIGEGKWIEPADLAGRYETAVNIDPLIRDLDPLWRLLETECIADCCGLDAFDFYPESIASAATQLDASEIARKLETLRAQLGALGKVCKTHPA